MIAGERADSGGLKMRLKARTRSHHQVDRWEMARAGRGLGIVAGIAVRYMLRDYRMCLPGHVSGTSRPTVPEVMQDDTLDQIMTYRATMIPMELGGIHLMMDQ
jgi:hypothetical protein